MFARIGILGAVKALALPAAMFAVYMIIAQVANGLAFIRNSGAMEAEHSRIVDIAQNNHATTQLLAESVKRGQTLESDALEKYKQSQQRIAELELNIQVQRSNESELLPCPKNCLLQPLQ